MAKARQKNNPNGGERDCLKCGKKFQSEDRIRNRLCPKCNRDNKNVYVPKVTSTGAWSE